MVWGSFLCYMCYRPRKRIGMPGAVGFANHKDAGSLCNRTNSSQPMQERIHILAGLGCIHFKLLQKDLHQRFCRLICAQGVL